MYNRPFLANKIRLRAVSWSSVFVRGVHARASVKPVSCVQSRAWSFYGLASFDEWTKKKRETSMSVVNQLLVFPDCQGNPLIYDIYDMTSNH